MNALGDSTVYVYDGNGNLVSKTDADGYVTRYSYTVLDLVKKINYNGAKEVSYQYNKVGELVQMDDWTGTNTFELDLLGRLQKMTDHKGNTVSYTYDAEGNVLTEFQRDSDATENLKSRTAFTYDALNRLTGSTRKLEVYPYDTLAYTYTYDTLGNLLKQSGPTKGEEDTYQYNDLNQMVSKHVCGYEQKLTRIYDYGYTYDKRGNLVKEEEICSPTTTGPKNITVATYLYDETNRMVQGTNKTGEVSAYTFNGLGVRVGTELILEDNSHGYTDFHCQTPSVETGIEKPEVVKTNYVIDYTRLGIDQRVLMKSEQDGYDFFYTYGLDKLQVMTIGEGSNWWGQSIKKCVNMAYVHTDRLGSVVNLSDQYGRVTARADYTDWGEVRRYTDITVDGGFRRLLPEITYATHEYDDVLNQFYAKARMYDAVNKRFDAVDPILNPAEYSISNYVSDPMMLVQYLYVRDNAVNRIDLLGLWTAAISLNGYIAGGWSVGASISLVIDGHGNIGVAITGSGGAGTPGVGVGVQIAYTNANTILDLGGVGAGLGGSVLGHGLDLSFGQAGDGSIVTGVAYTPSKWPASWKISAILSKVGSKVSQLLPTLSSAGSAAELHFLISHTSVQKIFGFDSYYNTIRDYFKTVTCTTVRNILSYTLGVSL